MLTRSCLVLSLVLVALPAAAQKPPDAAQRAEAERAGKEGQRLLDQHQPGPAVEALQRAYGLGHNVKFLLPLGLAYAEAGRPLDALDALGRYLQEAPALPDARRKEIGGKLQVLLDQVAAVVSIEATRQNAEVSVDGRAIGTTPIEAPLRLLPGKHEIVMQPAPTDPSSGAKAVIDLRPGERRTVKLEPGPRSRFLEPQSQAPPPAPPPAVKPSAPPPAPASRFAWNELPRKWWFWTAVGGTAAVLAVGLGAGLGTRGGMAGPADMVPAAPTWGGGVIDARGALALAPWRVRR